VVYHPSVWFINSTEHEENATAFYQYAPAFSMRYLSISKSLRRSNLEPARVFESEKTPLTAEDNDQSTIATGHTPLPPPNLKIKKVDHFYSRWSKKWKYQNSGSNAIPEAMALPVDGKDDPWQNFCFVVVRTLPRREEKEPTFQIVVKSPYLLKACKDVIAEVQGVSWNAVPLEVSCDAFCSESCTMLTEDTWQLDPKLILVFLPQFQVYLDVLKSKSNASEEDQNVMATVEVLINYFRKDYRATIASIENLTSHGEITFDLLYAIMVPRTIMTMTNPVTREPQAMQLATATKIKTGSGMEIYELILEGIDVDDTASNIKAFARTQSRMVVIPFSGTVKITSLDAYPLQYHPQEAEIRQKLLARGRKWTQFAHGVHHMYYDGTGAFRLQDCKITKYNASQYFVDIVQC
jgi:Domain of unknown function (DUF7025)